jgi:hypothetical protein
LKTKWDAVRANMPHFRFEFLGVVIMENENESVAVLMERHEQLLADMNAAIMEGHDAGLLNRITNQISDTDNKLFTATVIETQAVIESLIDEKNTVRGEIDDLYKIASIKRGRLNRALDLARLRESKVNQVQFEIELRQNRLESARRGLSDMHKKLNALKEAKLKEVTNRYEHNKFTIASGV